MELTCGEIVKEIIKSRKNSNLILKLEENLLSEDESIIISSIESSEQLFSHFLRNEELSSIVRQNDIGNSTSSESSAEEKYKTWLQERFRDCKSHLISLMGHENQDIRKLALEALMMFLKTEGQNTSEITRPDIPFSHYPINFLRDIVYSLLTSDIDMTPVINIFELYLKYDDMKLQVMRIVSMILISSAQKENMAFFQNAFILLTKIDISIYCGEHKKNFKGFNIFIRNRKGSISLKIKDLVKAFSQVWMKFLKFELPLAVYKKVLVYLPKNVLPYINDPLVLTDFLTDSYNYGGVVSLLALNGIFYLMQNLNLEYPDFFNKLYALFTQEILSSKFRARFFFLSDLFLSSTHLPAYLVAAFVKRLARLALCASPDVILIILTFIRNLLIRHPSLQTLIHTPCKEVATDPYDVQEPDPLKSHALESSLWEIKSLQSHWNPDVSKKAKFIDSELKQIECDFSDQLEVTLIEMAETELSRKRDVIPTAYDKPTTFFGRKEDTMNSVWTL